MGLVRDFRNDEYSPEYGTLMLRDTWDAAKGTESLEAAVPRSYPEDAQPCGTIARAGMGFLEGAARDGYHVVRLELHDAPPPDERADWPDLVETPYFSRTGAVMLTYVTSGGGPSADLHLGEPGRYAVRVARRRVDGSEDSDDEWCLRFWPDPDGSTVDLPRWVARREPATGPGRDGWDEVLGWPVRDFISFFRTAAKEADGATVEQIDAYGRKYRRQPGWLDAPLFPDPPAPLPTGHSDLDAGAERTRQQNMAMKAREAADLADVAGLLGVPAPRVPRDLLPLLVAAGMLTVDDSEGPPRYRFAQPRRAQDVLDLPPERVRMLERQDRHARYVSFTTDVVSIAVWARESPLETTVDALAARLLATPAEVRATLRYAAETGQLTVDGGDGDDQPVRLAVGPGRKPPTALAQPMPAPRPTPTGAFLASGVKKGTAGADLDDAIGAKLVQGEARVRLARLGGPARRPEPPAVRPLGAPPRAGFVTSGGDLVVWRDGEPVTLAPGTGRQPYVALQTAYGVALLTDSGCWHIRMDGEVEPLGEVFAAHAAVSEDGRLLAFTEATFGRRGWHRVHLVDLADGSRRTMPWDENDFLAVVGLHAGVVYVRGGAGLLRWEPDADPEPLPSQLREIDPLTGTRLTIEEHRELVVTRTDGRVTRISLDLSAALAPGGTRLYTLRDSPPAVTLFNVERGTADPVVHWLPRKCETSISTPRRPYWEDEHHLLFMLRHPDRSIGAPAIRLDVRTGAYEGVPLTAEAGYRPAFVRPLLRWDR